MKSITRMLLALFIFSLVSFSSYHINTGQADTIRPSPESLMLLKNKNGEISDQAKGIVELQTRIRDLEDKIKSLGDRTSDPMVCIISMRAHAEDQLWGEDARSGGATIYSVMESEGIMLHNDNRNYHKPRLETIINFVESLLDGKGIVPNNEGATLLEGCDWVTR